MMIKISSTFTEFGELSILEEVTYKKCIVEECEDGKSKKAILKNIVPAYSDVQ